MHVLLFGQKTAAFVGDTPVITAARMYEIDTKIDDARPGAGMLQSKTASYHPNCATTSVSTTAAYAVTSEGLVCVLLFLPEF